jgi:hypothetical protein
MMINAKFEATKRFGRLFRALATGSLVAFLPQITANFPESRWRGSIKTAIQFLMLPGAAVALLFDRNVHGIQIWLVEGIDVVFYSALAYFLMVRFVRR